MEKNRRTRAQPPRWLKMWRTVLNLPSTIGYPVVLRPAYTLGGTGGGIAHNQEELEEILENGLQTFQSGSGSGRSAVSQAGRKSNMR